MIKRNILTVITLLFVLLISASCIRKSTDYSMQSVQYTFSGTGSGGHIQKQLMDKLNVDADINAPREIQNLDILLANSLKLNSQKVKELKEKFIDNSTIIKQTTTKNGEFLQTEDGKIFTLQNDNMLSLNTDRFIYINQLFNLTNQTNSTEDLYQKNLDLSFMSYTQAVKKVKEYLDFLNISVNDDVEVYTLNNEAIQKKEEQFTNYKNSLSNQNINHIAQVHLNSEDEGYFIIFRNSLDDFSIFSSEHGCIDTYTMVSGPLIYAYYSKNGLEYLFISHPYEKVSVDKKDLPVIGLEDALITLKKKYENIVITSPISITGIEFNYVPTLINNSRNTFRMVPAWCFQFVQENGTPSKMIIDATNGREIL